MCDVTPFMKLVAEVLNQLIDSPSAYEFGCISTEQVGDAVTEWLSFFGYKPTQWPDVVSATMVIVNAITEHAVKPVA